MLNKKDSLKIKNHDGENAALYSRAILTDCTPGNMAALLFAIIFSCIAFSFAFASEVINVEKLADAIYKAENSVKYPYGIKSLRYENRTDKNLTKEQWARKICINTIRNNLKRFAKQDKYKDFISFLGSRYCPTTIKSEYCLNKNWVYNVTKFYN